MVEWEWGIREGQEEEIMKGHEKTFGVNDMLITLIMVMVSQMSTFVKIHQNVQLKYMQFIIF